jgi:hypothetical protein
MKVALTLAGALFELVGLGFVFYELAANRRLKVGLPLFVGSRRVMRANESQRVSRRISAAHRP